MKNIKLKERFIKSQKENPLLWVSILLFISMAFWYFNSSLLVQKLNKESLVTVGVIYKVTQENKYYKYLSNGITYESKDGYFKHNYYKGQSNDLPNIGDKILIRFYPQDPKVHKVYCNPPENLDSMVIGQTINFINLEKLSWWDIN